MRAALICLFTALLLPVYGQREENRPNFIIILTDDQGYNDLSCYGSTTIQTPQLDRIASEGRKFTDFYVTSSVCTPSRGSLLTGCYPKRIGLSGGVIHPHSTLGLHPNEHTLADHLKSIGYATTCIGKWHLGHSPDVLPRAHGFDSYYGIPYSNDMNHHWKEKKTSVRRDASWADQAGCLTNWTTPLLKNEDIIELPVDQRTITRRYTDQALLFMEAHKDEPFFLYLPHSMPHVPLYVPEDVYNPDPEQAYRCVIEHLDTEIGRIRQALDDLDLSKNTYLIFTSDNGPSLRQNNHGGSADPLRGGKSGSFEGGYRVPCLMWAPGRIPANSTSNAIVSTLDLLPTIASLTKSELPSTHVIDGLDVSTALNSDASSGREEILYYSSKGKLEGLRQGDWKLLIDPSLYRAKIIKGTFLYNLASDISEANNLAEKHPDLVTKLSTRMKELDAQLGKEARPAWQKDKKSQKTK